MPQTHAIHSLIRRIEKTTTEVGLKMLECEELDNWTFVTFVANTRDRRLRNKNIRMWIIERRYNMQ